MELLKKYYTKDKIGQDVEVDRQTAMELIRIGKKRPEDFEIEESSLQPNQAPTGTFEEPTDYQPIPEPVPKTLAENVSGFVQKAAQYPMGMTADPRNVYGALKEGVAPTYYELMPQLERGAEMVGEDVRSAMPPDESAISKYGIAPISMSTFPPRPSMMMMGGERAISQLMGRSTKMLASPAIVEKGLERGIQSMGRKGLLPEMIGQTAREAVKKPVSYPEVAPKIYEKPIRMKEVGETLTRAIKEKLSKLKVVEKEKYKPLEQYGDAPVEIGKQVDDSIQAVAKESGIADRSLPKSLTDQDLARSLMDNYGMAQDDAMAALRSMGAEEMNFVLQSTKNPEFSHLAKIMADLRRPGLTFREIKNIASELGDRIDWGAPRSDRPNYLMKQMYNTLDGIKKQTAEKGGFGKQFAEASQSTKDVYGYLGKETTRTIQKAKYPSEIQGKLIKAETPERVTELFNEHSLSTTDKQMVRRGVLDRISEKSGGDVNKFRSSLNKYNKETRKELFGESSDLVESLLVETSDDMKKFTKLVETGEPSQFIDNLMSKKNQTPEMARILKNVLNEKQQKAVEQGIINKILEKTSTKTKKGESVSSAGLSSEMEKLDNKFVGEFFGDNSKTVLALKDASKLFRESSIEAKPKFPWTEVTLGAGAGFATGGPIGATIGAGIGRFLPILNQLGKKYRIPSNVFKMLENEYGRGIAKELLPGVLRERKRPPVGAVGLTLPAVKEESK